MDRTKLDTVINEALDKIMTKRMEDAIKLASETTMSLEEACYQIREITSAKIVNAKTGEVLVDLGDIKPHRPLDNKKEGR